MSIFEQASRAKLRFQSQRGELTVEQLWDLPLKSEMKTSLNQLAIDVSKDISAESTVDFVDGGKSGATKINALKLDVLKHVIEIKKSENLAKQNLAALSSEEQLLKEELAKRNLAKTTSGSDAEIQARIDAIAAARNA